MSLSPSVSICDDRGWFERIYKNSRKDPRYREPCESYLQDVVSCDVRISLRISFYFSLVLFLSLLLSISFARSRRRVESEGGTK